jgi:chromosome segregation ATPase
MDSLQDSNKEHHQQEEMGPDAHAPPASSSLLSKDSFGEIIQRSYEEQEKIYMSTVAELLRERDAERHRNAELAHALKTQCDANSNLAKHLREATPTMVDIAKRELRAAQATLLTEQLTNRELRVELHAVKAKLNYRNDTSSDLRRKIEVLEDCFEEPENETLRFAAAVTKLQHENDVLRKEIPQTLEYVTLLQERLDAEVASKKALEHEKMTLVHINMALNEQVDNLEGSLETIRVGSNPVERISKLENKLNAEGMARVELEFEYDELKEQLYMERESSQRTMDDLSRKSNAEISALRAKLNEKDTIIEQLETEVIKKTTIIKSFRASLCAR